MKSKILIGIDMGSSSLKALALEADSGRSVALSRLPLPQIRLPGGGCEVDAATIRNALTHVLREVAHQMGPRVAEVCAIACTGHGAGLYALDTHGQLLGGRAVASGDQRGATLARDLALRQGPQLVEQVGCSPWPGQPTILAAALLGPSTVQRGELRHLLFAKDYLGFLMTGEVATDASDASTAGLLSLSTGDWSQAAFDASGLVGLTPRHMARIAPSGTVIGRLLPAEATLCGLPPGIPVAMGAIDLLASMTAVGAETRQRAVSVLGTWCVNAVIGPVIEPKPAVIAIVNFGRTHERLYMENSPSSMANVAWLASVLGLPDTRAVVDLAMTVPLGANGLRFLPFVNGGGGTTAGFVGLQGHHTRADMARAVVDAVVALHARHTERLVSYGLAAAHSTMLGGGASDVRLGRLLATFLGRSVERCADDETGARGAAIYAAMSQGLADAGPGSALLAPLSITEPEAGNHRAHTDFMADFNSLIDTMSPVFSQLSGTAP